MNKTLKIGAVMFVTWLPIAIVLSALDVPLIVVCLIALGFGWFFRDLARFFGVDIDKW